MYLEERNCNSNEFRNKFIIGDQKITIECLETKLRLSEESNKKLRERVDDLELKLFNAFEKKGMVMNTMHKELTVELISSNNHIIRDYHQANSCEPKLISRNRNKGLPAIKSCNTYKLKQKGLDSKSKVINSKKSNLAEKHDFRVIPNSKEKNKCNKKLIFNSCIPNSNVLRPSILEYDKSCTRPSQLNESLNDVERMVFSQILPLNSEKLKPILRKQSRLTKKFRSNSINFINHFEEFEQKSIKSLYLLPEESVNQISKELAKSIDFSEQFSRQSTVSKPAYKVKYYLKPSTANLALQYKYEEEAHIISNSKNHRKNKQARNQYKIYLSKK